MPSKDELKELANIKGWYTNTTNEFKNVNKDQLIEALNIKEDGKYYVFTQKDLDDFLGKCRVVKK